MLVEGNGNEVGKVMGSIMRTMPAWVVIPVTAPLPGGIVHGYRVLTEISLLNRICMHDAAEGHARACM